MLFPVCTLTNGDFYCIIHMMILVPTEIKNDILNALYDEVGLNTDGQGIAFSMPVDGVVRLSSAQEKKDE